MFFARSSPFLCRLQFAKAVLQKQPFYFIGSHLQQQKISQIF